MGDKNKNENPGQSKEFGDYLRDAGEWIGILQMGPKPKMHQKMKDWLSKWKGTKEHKGHIWRKHTNGKWYLEVNYQYWKYEKNADYFQKDIEKIEEEIAKKEKKIAKLEEQYAGKKARLDFLYDELKRLKSQGVIPEDASYILIDHHIQKLEEKVGATGSSTSGGKIPKLEGEIAELRKKLAGYEDQYSRSRKHMFFWHSQKSSKK